MIRWIRRGALAGILLAIAGCAVGPTAHRPSGPAAPAPLAATRPTDPALLPLDELLPTPILAAPTTQPTTRAPVEALQLYARARAAMLDNQRYAAIALLEKAAELDPYSYDVAYALGEAYLGHETSDDRSLAAFLKAARIEPDHLDLQVIVGRQYLSRDDVPHAIEHLRLALQTTDYKQDEEQAAVADFFLARALQQYGYDRAALDEYDQLMHRLDQPDFVIHNDPELNFLLSRPELLYVQIGQLYEKHNDYAQALRAYEAAADRDPANFDLQQRVVHTQLSLGRSDDATRRAADVVMRFHASSESLALLREVYRRIGQESEVADVLERLHQQRPADRALIFSLSDLLVSQGKLADAESLLGSAARSNPGDFEFVHHLFSIYDQRGDTLNAARVLIEALADQPDSLRLMSPLWGQLLRPSHKNHLQLQLLQHMQVSPRAESARLYWIDRLAEMWHRDVVARNALEAAVKLQPPFAPAYRALLNQLWERDDLTPQQKVEACQKLADSAANADPALADELRGLSLLAQGRALLAVAALGDAVAASPNSVDRQLTYASALHVAGNDARAEQLLWKLVSDHPEVEEAWLALFNNYYKGDEPRAAVKVLSEWLAADPGNVNARVLQATVFYRSGRPDLAEEILLKLFDDNGDNEEVLSALQELYTSTGRTDDFVNCLRRQWTRQPGDPDVLYHLVDIYADQRQIDKAMAVLDAARTAAGNDPDLLYSIAHLYDRIDRQDMTEQLLEQVVKIDPTHAPANNDLGYSWADEGKNLDRAEKLVRTALLEEPDNQSFLDSLGWVLYKRGKFAESYKYLQEAVAPATKPDPVVLDHLGDVLYRLHRISEAQQQWRRSEDRLHRMIPTDRDDLKNLDQRLEEKLRQADRGQPVNVAPVVSQAPPAAPAAGGAAAVHAQQ